VAPLLRDCITVGSAQLSIWSLDYTSLLDLTPYRSNDTDCIGQQQNALAAVRSGSCVNVNLPIMVAKDADSDDVMFGGRYLRTPINRKQR
jgi:hypothetical protein